VYKWNSFCWGVMLCTNVIVSAACEAVYKWYRIKSVCYEHQLPNDAKI